MSSRSSTSCSVPPTLGVLRMWCQPAPTSGGSRAPVVEHVARFVGYMHSMTGYGPFDLGRDVTYLSSEGFSGRLPVGLGGCGQRALGPLGLYCTLSPTLDVDRATISTCVYTLPQLRIVSALVACASLLVWLLHALVRAIEAFRKGGGDLKTGSPKGPFLLFIEREKMGDRYLRLIRRSARADAHARLDGIFGSSPRREAVDRTSGVGYRRSSASSEIPRVIESQRGRNCAIHATNNALQRVVVTEADVAQNLRLRFDKYSESSRSRKNPTELHWPTFRSEQTRLGYHFEDLIPALNQQGYMVNMSYGIHSPNLPRLMLSGSWVVLGRYETFDHAIAVYNGHVIDSLLSKVSVPYHFASKIRGATSDKDRLRLMFPAGFTPRLAIAIEPNGNRRGTSRTSARSTTIDLRSP